jgi:Ca-activated chloride channel family protein
MRMVTFAAVVCLLGFTLVPRAQTSIGTVSGTVKDSSGTPLPGANVRISRNGGSTQSRVTDTKGSFTFLRVPAADYDLTATLSNFAPFTVRVSVRAGGTASVAVVLTPGTVAEKAARDNAQMELSLDARTLSRAAAMSPTVAGGIAAPMAQESMPYPRPAYNTEAYDRIDENPFRRVAVDPLSTFSIDVDTASYANVRRYLNAGTLPPPDAVRIEELINYFRFDYAQPAKDVPFAVTTELAVCPWNTKHRLALVGLQSRALDLDKVPARNLVFLLDVSGSMSSPDKLPLVRTAMRMLVDTLTGRDTIAIVVYAGASGVVLPPTSGAHKETIHAAIARLEAGGSTNGAAGIILAYQVAQANFVKGGINRVILATDGDFNVGVTNQGDLTRLIEEKRSGGIFLSVLGVGTGNVKDSTMEKLADRGNGNYSYLDTLHEARKVLVHEGGATLVTVAKDVKIQVEFNPAHVAAYRLVGYENRMLKNEDFNNDKKDAGEIGAGHTVTALYELVPPGADADLPTVDPLKYQRPTAPAAGARSDEVMTVKLRYKAPDADDSRLITVAIKNRLTESSPNIGFAAAVAEFGMLLRNSESRGTATHADAAAMARRFRGADPDGYRAEFIKLVELAGSLKTLAQR